MDSDNTRKRKRRPKYNPLRIAVFGGAAAVVAGAAVYGGTRALNKNNSSGKQTQVTTESTEEKIVIGDGFLDSESTEIIDLTETTEAAEFDISQSASAIDGITAEIDQAKENGDLTEHAVTAGITAYTDTDDDIRLIEVGELYTGENDESYYYQKNLPVYAYVDGDPAKGYYIADSKVFGVVENPQDQTGDADITEPAATDQSIVRSAKTYLSTAYTAIQKAKAADEAVKIDTEEEEQEKTSTTVAANASDTASGAAADTSTGAGGSTGTGSAETSTGTTGGSTGTEWPGTGGSAWAGTGESGAGSGTSTGGSSSTGGSGSSAGGSGSSTGGSGSSTGGSGTGTSDMPTVVTPDKIYFPNVTTTALTNADVSGISAQTAQNGINELYARNGYRFSNQNLYNFYSQYSWYNPDTSDTATVYARFNDTEKKNFNTLYGITQGTSAGTGSTGTGSTGTSTGGTTTDTTSSGGLVPDISTKLLTTGDLQSMDQSKVVLALDELYARKGYKFTTKSVYDYFSQFSWYKPTDATKSEIEQSFTATEQENYQTLSDYILEKGL